MRSKIAVAAGMVVVTVTVLAILWMPPTEPQLRVDMSIDDVDKELGKEEAGIDRLLYTVKFYREGPDWLGGQSADYRSL
jgi:hypothetical protein